MPSQFEQTNIHAMTRTITLSSIFLFTALFSSGLWAQANDNCSTATVITDPTEFCIESDNTFATPDLQTFPSCWSNVSTDIWYSFTAVAPDLAMVIKGATPTYPLGTMFGPQIAVYGGDCNNLTELGCAADLSFNNNLPLVVNNLVIGQTYYIRIDAVISGQFQCCLKNQVNVSTVPNDNCNTATVISDPTDFCVEGDNSLANADPSSFPSCWSNVNADLWYSFTAQAPDLVVITKGSTPSYPFGTMFGPQVAVYSGDCNNLTEIACAADLNFTNNLPLVVNNLVVGQTYYIRVDGVQAGQFQCCIKNQPNISAVSSDCPTAQHVCSKNPIQVDQVFGSGLIFDELADAPCFQSAFPPYESSSAWFEFTAANDGKLTFTLTPNNPNDDLDFVLYRLPNGPGNCDGKISERCMAAGDFTAASPCMGPTGLNLTATDISQPPGCAVGMDNFLRYLKLTPGATYALVVNNFTTVGNGFSIEWGGDAEFEGGTIAKFQTDEPDQRICLGEEIVVTDSSSVNMGTITKWSWEFGDGSIADSIVGQGPHKVQYQTLGPKSLILNVETDKGCTARDTAFLLVEFCCTMDAAVSYAPGCPPPGNPSAQAQVSVVNGLSPITATWSNGQTGTNATLANSGPYYVNVEDANGCKDSVSFVVNTPKNVSASFPQDTSIFEKATVALSTGAVPADSVLVWWISPAGDTLVGPLQNLSPSETTTYFVVVNNTGCEFYDSVTVNVKKLRYDRPNAFTPNGDGANDTFGPVLVGNTLVQLEVWSRWGDKVFDSLIDGKNTWDGTINGEPAPSDVYVYRVKVKLTTGEEKTDWGDVTLLR